MRPLPCLSDVDERYDLEGSKAALEDEHPLTVMPAERGHYFFRIQRAGHFFCVLPHPHMSAGAGGNRGGNHFPVCADEDDVAQLRTIGVGKTNPIVLVDSPVVTGDRQSTDKETDRFGRIADRGSAETTTEDIFEDDHDHNDEAGNRRHRSDPQEAIQVYLPCERGKFAFREKISTLLEAYPGHQPQRGPDDDKADAGPKRLTAGRRRVG